MLDSIRGFSLLSMILYHALWDLVYFFGFNLEWYKSTAAHIWQQSICWTFILLSGFCQPLGRKSIRRGLLVLFCSVIVTVFSLIAMPQTPIIFGILTLIGSCMVLSFVADRPLKKTNPYLGFILFSGIFIFMKISGNGIFPDTWNKNLFTAYFGFSPPCFHSADYYPLFPWIFLYFSGYFLCLIFKKREMMGFLCSPRIRFLEYLGRHSLLIYMAHQPIIYVVLYLLFK
ncbi:MAG: heparan-alpha-glucosaminide N-acetyltransferase domain-containing protein [Monoglobales bacterium]